jgi:hypothetical protein
VGTIYVNIGRATMEGIRSAVDFSGGMKSSYIYYPLMIESEDKPIKVAIINSYNSSLIFGPVIT